MKGFSSGRWPHAEGVLYAIHQRLLPSGHYLIPLLVAFPIWLRAAPVLIACAWLTALGNKGAALGFYRVLPSTLYLYYTAVSIKSQAFRAIFSLK